MAAVLLGDALLRSLLSFSLRGLLSPRSPRSGPRAQAGGALGPRVRTEGRAGGLRRQALPQHSAGGSLCWRSLPPSMCKTRPPVKHMKQGVPVLATSGFVWTSHLPTPARSPHRQGTATCPSARGRRESAQVGCTTCEMDSGFPVSLPIPGAGRAFWPFCSVRLLGLMYNEF